MLRARPVLANVLLCLVFLPTLTPRRTQKKTQICSLDSITQVDSLIEEAPAWKWLDTKLYTPAKDDYKQKCPRSTMNCFASEINVLLEEWMLNDAYSRLSNTLKRLGESMNQTDLQCPQCERLQEKNAKTFLKVLREAVEYMNTANC